MIVCVVGAEEGHQVRYIISSTAVLVEKMPWRTSSGSVEIATEMLIQRVAVALSTPGSWISYFARTFPRSSRYANGT